MHTMLRAAAFALLAVGLMWSQTGQGIIVGTVTDESGAIIPGAAVRLQNIETGFTYSAVANQQGIYRVPYLNPGTYSLTFEAAGFKRLVRSNIQVRSTETVRVNVTLQLGAVVESIEVSASAQLLETETATTGHLVAGRVLNNIPTPQMKIQTIMYYMPGVTSQRGFGHVAGQRSRAFNATMDGVSGMEPVRGEVSTNRFLATVQHNMAEVKILTTALPAEYGHSGGGIMNISYKGGTNEIHGLAEERYVHGRQIHRNWGDAQPRVGPLAFHLMTGTLSGPVLLPKIYDGRNKTFWLFGFQRHHEKASENNDRDVPSPEMLQGDFSFGGLGDTIYDPASLVRLPNGSYSRSPFPGNLVPQGRFSPVARNFLALDPYRPPDNRNNQTALTRRGPVNNLSADTTYRSYRTGFDWKIDHSFSDSHKIFGRYSDYRHRSFNGRWQVQFANKIFDYNHTPIPIDQHQLAISDSITLSPTTINEIRVGANRRKFTRIPASLGQDWAGQLGIPNVGIDTMPSFLDSGGSNLFGARFPEGAETDVTENMSLQENLTMVRGRHTFKMGYELLHTRANSRVNAQPSGRYYFGGTEFPFAAANTTGHPFASFLLGSVTRADFTQDLATWLPRWWTHSLYFQTDWKATPNLTLNLGVRWQYETSFSTKYGQQSQFDPAGIDPLTGRQGALMHPSGPLGKRDLNNFQPRLGMAYNFKSDWVFRAGFAVNTLDVWTNGLRENFDEYFATAAIQPPPGNPDIAFYIHDGPPAFQFDLAPNGTAPFIGSNFGGRSASFYDPKLRAPYVMNWNAGFQWQMTDTTLWEFSYQGSSGVGLLNRWNINQVPLSIASDFNQLNAIRKAEQNFKPYPHFGSVWHYSNYGHNSFHSGTLRFEKRYSHGITFNSFYTWSKAIDDASSDGRATGQSFYNRSLEKARSDYDVAHRWISYALWELPFGSRRKWDFGNRFANGVLGGWNLGVIQSLESGVPLSFTHTGSPNVFLAGGGVRRADMAPNTIYDDIRLDWDRHGPCRHIIGCAEPWADIDAFAYPASFTTGNSGRNIVNGPGMLWHQLSIQKEFPLKERVKGMLRFDVNNPFKTYFFSPPNTAVNLRNPVRFGKITNNQGSFSGQGGRLYMHLIFRLEF